MPGVSSRAPVAGAYGVSKIYFKFKPKKIKKTSIMAYVIWLCFGCMMYFMYAWPKPLLRYNVIVPILRRACAGFNFVFNFNFENSGESLSRDSSGVPYLLSTELSRTIYLQGYAHAADRLSQMDVLRRTATGRLSELYGNRTIEADKQSLALNFYNIAIEDLASLSEEESGLLMSYSNGVNKFIDDSSSGTLASKWIQFPVDWLRWAGWGNNYKHPHVDMWEPVHTLAVMRLLAYQWSSGWEDQLLHSLFGYEAPSAQAQFLASLGGNSFVVSGTNTRSGEALLASDFQAQVSAEGLWYKNSLETPSMHVSGVSIPGIPFVLMGRNEHISWSFTAAAGHKDGLIPIDPEAEGVKVSTRQEALKVSSNGTDYFVAVDLQQTYLPGAEQVVPSVGDLVSPRVRAYMNAHQEKAVMSLRLMSHALQHRMNLQFFHQLNVAKNREDFLSACASLKVMALNVLYADVEGHIGTAVTSSDPLKSEFDPPRGWFVSSSVTQADGGARVESLLQAQLSTRKLSAVDAQRILMDEYSPSSLLLVDLIQRIDTSTARMAAFDSDVVNSIQLAKNITRHFDGRYSADSIAPAVLEAFRSALLHNAAEASTHPLAQLLIQGGTKAVALKRHQDPNYGSLWLIEHFHNRASTAFSEVYLKQMKMSRDIDSIITNSIVEAVSWCRTHHGAKESGWQWGKVHSAVYLHSSVPKFYLYDAIWSRGPHPMGGGVDSVFNSQYVMDNRIYEAESLWYTKSVGSSLRLVVDAGVNGNGRVLANSPTGQSTNIQSPYYNFNSIEQFTKVMAVDDGICFDVSCIERQVPSYCQDNNRVSRLCGGRRKNSEL